MSKPARPAPPAEPAAQAKARPKFRPPNHLVTLRAQTFVDRRKQAAKLACRTKGRHATW